MEKKGDIGAPFPFFLVKAVELDSDIEITPL